MDIKRSKKRRRFKPYLYVAAVIGVSSLVFAYASMFQRADYVVQSDNIVFGEVKEGPINVRIRGSGVLHPEEVNWLAANVQGRVSKLYVKPGHLVTRGEIIAQLENVELVHRLDEIRWELEALQAEARASRVGDESALLDLESVVLDAKLDYEKSKVEYESRYALRQITQGSVAEIEFKQSRLDTIQTKQRWEFQQKRLEKMQEKITAKQLALEARIEKTKKIAERVQSQVDDLTIKASIDSVVQDVAIENGQRVNIGDNIAVLARQDDLIAELQIPELQVRDVVVGQPVEIDTRNNKMLGQVSRIDPAVVNGNVQIDVLLDLPLSSDARPELAVDGVITVASIDRTLYVEKPIYSHRKSDSYVFILSPDGNFVEKTSVRWGVSSVNTIEILDGLKVGDKVVISDSTRWEMYKKIRIN